MKTSKKPNGTNTGETSGQATKRSGKGLSDGVVSELAAFFTVKPGHEEELRAAVRRFADPKMFVPDPKGTQRMGLRDARYVIFNGGQQLLWATTFETDWDSYIDDALLIIGIEHFLDWMQHTVEGDKVVEWAASVDGFEKFDKNDPTLGETDWGALPQHFIQKNVELRRLLYRHPTTFLNPEIIIQGAKHFCMQGDSTFLEEKLEYLRSVDVITHHVEQAGQDNVVV